MSSFAHALKPARLVVYWIIFFVPVYLVTIVLYGYWNATLNLFSYLAMQSITPLMYILMSWLYFRKVGLETWTARLAVAVIWIFLTILASAILIQPVYGYDWRYAINVGVMNAQLVNIAGVLIGSLLASHERHHRLTKMLKDDTSPSI